MEDLKKSEAVMEEWRNYLRSGNADIFEIIERAIMVAASDHPMEFRMKRDKIVQTLFSCELINHVEEGNIDCKEKMKMSGDVVKNHLWDTISHGDTQETLVHEHDQETEMVTDDEVLRIKEILDKSCGDASESAVVLVYESLSKLQHM
ncbi:probable mediator of RNA polymerase II transcription subunit 26a, partial [Cynara cardunculus var. scolymus]